MDKTTIKIPKWDNTKEMSVSEDVSFSKALSNYAKSLDILDTEYYIPELNKMAVFDKKSLNESIAGTVKRRGNLLNLAKLFTILPKIVKEMAFMEKEEYRHTSRKASRHILYMYQYLAAFQDDVYLYPVKITIEESQKNSRVYIVVTVGELELDKIKETLLIARVQSTNNVDESLSDGDVSSTYNIPQLVKFFNKKQSNILKNLPDEWLSAEQKAIKQKVFEDDKKKDLLILSSLFF